MFRVLSIIAALTAAYCGGDGGLCDPVELADALANAVPGDTVEIGDCTIAGSFTVPAGVILRGQSRETSKLLSVSRAPVLLLQPGAFPATRVEHLSIDSNARFGIRFEGTGMIELRDVEVRATEGVAIAIRGANSARLIDVAIASEAISASSSSNVATHGLVVVNTVEAVLEQVRINGFGEVGALFVHSNVRWNSGDADANRANGLIVEDGQAVLTDLSISRTIAKISPMRSWAAVFNTGATIESSALTLQDNEAYGALHIGTAEVTHDALTATNNDNTPLWLTSVPNIRVTNSVFDRNQFAGIVAHQTSSFTLANTTISNTRSVQRMLELDGPVTIGDGLQLKESTLDIEIDQLQLIDNEHAGMLIELGSGSTAGITIAQTTASVASATAFGAVAQNGTIVPGWDANITRNFDPARDLTSGLPSVGAVGPCEFPTPTGLENRPLDMLVPP